MADTVSRRHSAPVLRNSQTNVTEAHGGKSFLKVALLLLAVWFVGVLGLYDAGDLVHIFLLIGLLMLLLGALKLRDAARHHTTDSGPDAQ